LKIDKKFLKKIVKEAISILPKEEERLVKVADQFETLSYLYKRVPYFRNLLSNPKLENQKKLEFINKLSSELGLDEVVKLSLNKIIENKKANVLKEISKVFRFQVEKFFATVKGEVITAYPIDEELLNEIKEVVENKIGKKIEFETKVDDSIIGGVIIKAGSYIIDSSIRNYIKQLEISLTKI